MRNRKIFVLFLNQNICCGYLQEPSQWDGCFEHPKHMLKIMCKKIFTILHRFFWFIYTYGLCLKKVLYCSCPLCKDSSFIDHAHCKQKHHRVLCLCKSTFSESTQKSLCYALGLCNTSEMFEVKNICINISKSFGHQNVSFFHLT